MIAYTIEKRKKKKFILPPLRILKLTLTQTLKKTPVNDTCTTKYVTLKQQLNSHMNKGGIPQGGSVSFSFSKYSILTNRLTEKIEHAVS